MTDDAPQPSDPMPLGVRAWFVWAFGLLVFTGLFMGRIVEFIDFSERAPFSLLGIFMMPWRLMSSMGDYIFTWLVGYSGLMGAIAGILICDYWLLRKQKLDLAALFDPRGPYSYAGGTNWRAVAALAIAIAPVGSGQPGAFGRCEPFAAYQSAGNPLEVRVSSPDWKAT